MNGHRHPYAAASSVVVHRKVYAEFVERFAAGAKGLRVGNGLEPGTQMGACVSAAPRACSTCAVWRGGRLGC